LPTDRYLVSKYELSADDGGRVGQIDPSDGLSKIRRRLQSEPRRIRRPRENKFLSALRRIQEYGNCEHSIWLDGDKLWTG
jgi:hypothetical protein